MLALTRQTLPAHLEQLTTINSTLFHLLEHTRRSLAGQRDFDVEIVRKISSIVSQADPFLLQASERRTGFPELAPPLDHYLRLAAEMHSALEKANVMLLARRSALDSARTQLHAALQFINALSTTG
jgi:hypothetical protein